MLQPDQSDVSVRTDLDDESQPYLDKNHQYPKDDCKSTKALKKTRIGSDFHFDKSSKISNKMRSSGYNIDAKSEIVERPVPEGYLSPESKYNHRQVIKQKI